MLGAGQMGRFVAERGVALGFEVTVAARRPPSWRLPVFYTPLHQAGELAPFDVLAACLGAGAPVYEAAALPSVRRLAIDFATPRNLGEGFDAPLITTAGILAQQAADPALIEQRGRLQSRLRELLAERLGTASPTSESSLISLRDEVEVIRQRELARAAKDYPELPISALDTITRSLVNEIFQRSSARLRGTVNAELAEALGALFESARAKQAEEDLPSHSPETNGNS